MVPKQFQIKKKNTNKIFQEYFANKKLLSGASDIFKPNHGHIWLQMQLGASLPSRSAWCANFPHCIWSFE
jgi:hypothetical protein